MRLLPQIPQHSIVTTRTWSSYCCCVPALVSPTSSLVSKHKFHSISHGIHCRTIGVIAVAQTDCRRLGRQSVTTHHTGPVVYRSSAPHKSSRLPHQSHDCAALEFCPLSYIRTYDVGESVSTELSLGEIDTVIPYGSMRMMGRWTMPSPLYIILSPRQTVMRNKSCWRSRNPGHGRWRFIEQNRGEWGRDVTVGATVDDVSLLYQRQFPACNEDPVVPICRYYLIATITCSDSIDCAPVYSNSLTATIASRKSLQLYELVVHTG